MGMMYLASREDFTAYTMNIYSLSVVCDTTEGELTVTLPGVSEAVGQVVTVRHQVGEANVHIHCSGDDTVWEDVDLLLGSAVGFLSDGIQWHSVIAVTTPEAPVMRASVMEESV